ncbi:MAG TPA: hypothetical protein VK308_13985 [Pyrinomonadaceae bacterium]|nr:hypothetical protein [Pyrinomonadaceae bacterium]
MVNRIGSFDFYTNSDVFVVKEFLFERRDNVGNVKFRPERGGKM